MEHALQVAESIATLQAPLKHWRAAGLKIGFVPTMGALHAGHMALVEQARAACDKVVVSIFVNPTQFGPNEDLSRYPRPIEADKALLQKHGADLLFLPTPEVIYPAGFSSKVEVGALGEVLCGAFRPGHFSGVATVVTILLNLVAPDSSFFGEKDYQQLLIIKRICRDLHLPGTIIGCPTVRESDGLALSSRNQYLSPEERRIAPKLYETMLWVKENASLSLRGAQRRSNPDKLKTGLLRYARNDEEKSLTWLIDSAKSRLLAAGFTKIDYLEARHQETLELIENTDKESRLFAAAWLGKTRLLDNIRLSD